MKRTLTLIALSLIFAANLAAQSRITEEQFSVEDDKVLVRFDVETKHNNIPKNRKEVILPYLYNGADTVYLPSLEVYGRNRYKREKQEKHIAGDKKWVLGEGQILKGDVYSYTASTPLKRWMQPASLGIKRFMVGCACENDIADQQLSSAQLFEEPGLPARRIPQPVLADATRDWFLDEPYEIIFRVSKIDIDSTIFNNEITFGKILAAVDKIHSTPDLKIEKIEVSGYASPEGRPGFNTWLGENRAKVLINYIIEHRPQYGLTMENFSIRNGEENWDGLKRALLDSQMAYRDEVIEIIDNASLAGEQKKARIKAMDGGRVWAAMLKDIYPYLRSSRYLAVTYDSSNHEAVEIINKANDLIESGQIAEASQTLMSVKDDARAANTIGAVLMLQGKFEEAMPWFMKAEDFHPEAARANIKAIEAEYSYEAEQKAALEEYLKKYE